MSTIPNKSDTKNDLISKLEEANRLLKESSNNSFATSVQESQKPSAKAITATAKDLSMFSREMQDKFNTYDAAIEAQEEKLQELYAVEKELLSLTVVTDAAAKIIRDKTTEKTEAIALYEKAVQDAEKNYKAKLREIEAERLEDKKAYDFDLKWKRYEDEKKFTSLRKDKEDAMDREREALNAEIEEFEEMKESYEAKANQLEGVPALLLEEYQRGHAEGVKTTNMSNSFEVRSLKAANASEISLLEKDKQYQTEKLAAQADTIADLTMRLSDAYSKMHSLASDSVGSVGNARNIADLKEMAQNSKSGK